MTTYIVTHTNYQNENTEVTVYGATDQKDAWNKAEAAKRKYLTHNEQLALGLVTAIREA